MLPQPKEYRILKETFRPSPHFDIKGCYQLSVSQFIYLYSSLESSYSKLLHSMDNAPAILKLCHEINELESEADRSLRSAMSKIFREEPDVREVVKLKEIYELLESVTDRCKDVASTVEAIVLENS